MNFPVIKRTAYVLCHVPDLVRFGCECSGMGNGCPPDPAENFRGCVPQEGLRSYSEALKYAPNQVFIGNLSPKALWDLDRPWWLHPLNQVDRYSPWGEIMPQEQFYALLRCVDDCHLVLLDEKFADRMKAELADHACMTPEDCERIRGVSLEKITKKLNDKQAIPLISQGNPVGCVMDYGRSDPNHSACLLLENLAAKASGVLAMRHVLKESALSSEVDYILSCGEEAVGDRGQRGGGGLARAIAESSGCEKSTGSDVKAFCCAPVHALVMAACQVQAGLYDLVAVVAGGSLAKLGLHHQACLKNGMPVLEDVLAAFAVLIGKDDGKSPQIRLDCVGRHPAGRSSAPGVMMEELVVKPLQRLQKTIPEVDLFALELHNADIMIAAGKGDISANHYRLLAATAVSSGQMNREMIDHFARTNGSPGFAPTQGHMASAVPLLGHAQRMILKGEIENCLFVGRGSSFLGRMTQSSDGLSFLMDRE